MKSTSKSVVAAACSVCLLLLPAASPAAQPLKVYILAGQSNMEGQARLSTFDYIGLDPATAPLLKEMRDPDGRPHVCDRVWISYYTGIKQFGEGFGKLTAGYGSRPNPAEPGDKIGPEFTFGLTMEKAYDGPILLIKTAWGGKSLHTDFRPPSAGPYKLPAKTRALWDKHPQGAHGIPKAEDRAKWQAEKDAQTGRFYREMIDYVRKVLADPKRVCPAYDPAAGYEIAGFVWFQGWNDMCDRQTYPDSDQPGGYDEYTTLMADFIRDVRKDLNAPNLPFVIGVIGVDGDRATGGIANLRPAMAAPASMPEFKGTVAAVETAPFWDHRMAELMPKKAKVDHILAAGHILGDDGWIEKPVPGEPGWQPLGTPAPDKRVWRFVAVDPREEKDVLPKNEKKRWRQITLPEGLAGWQMPDFDDSQWASGQAPIGVGVWKERDFPVVQYNAHWPEGEFLLMRTRFDVASLDKYEAFRLAVLSRQGFEVYLNGHLIDRYIWWQNAPFYRAIPLGDQEVKYLKPGPNVLAVYANVEYDRKTGEPFNAIDARIEGITKDALAYVNSEAYKLSRMDKVCTREEGQIILGASNGGYHYLGSAKIMAQIGKAFAQAMLKLQGQ